MSVVDKFPERFIFFVGANASRRNRRPPDYPAREIVLCRRRLVPEYIGVPGCRYNFAVGGGLVVHVENSTEYGGRWHGSNKRFITDILAVGVVVGHGQGDVELGVMRNLKTLDFRTTDVGGMSNESDA